ncbi:hypothetical protein HGRIS_002606 [Hohenbuehelia grisea]|uniref:Uncharacterized protein n=1 Tax=Hohenbuehelia grisea TaxID=104357 RepID=A0ABR3JLX1_9AGAR
MAPRRSGHPFVNSGIQMNNNMVNNFGSIGQQNFIDNRRNYGNKTTIKARGNIEYSPVSEGSSGHTIQINNGSGTFHGGATEINHGVPSSCTSPSMPAASSSQPNFAAAAPFPEPGSGHFNDAHGRAQSCPYVPMQTSDFPPIASSSPQEVYSAQTSPQYPTRSNQNPLREMMSDFPSSPSPSSPISPTPNKDDLASSSSSPLPDTSSSQKDEAAASPPIEENSVDIAVTNKSAEEISESPPASPPDAEPSSEPSTPASSAPAQEQSADEEQLPAEPEAKILTKTKKPRFAKIMPVTLLARLKGRSATRVDSKEL